jgi:hypothetical protein
MRKVTLGVLVMTCATSCVVAADMPVPASLYSAPAPVYNWTDWYFGFYFAGRTGGSWGVSINTGINTAFAFAYVFPSLSTNASIGGGQMGADRQSGNFAGGVFQGVSTNTAGAATVAIPSKCDAAPTRCGGTTTQSLFQNQDFLGAILAKSGHADDNSLSVGIEGSNSDGNYNRVGRASGDGVTGVSMKGTLNYKFDWQ